MLAASAMGEKSATFGIVLNAISTGQLGKYSAQVKQLVDLAQNTNDSQAMAILGSALMASGQEKEALAYFQKATRAGLEFDGAGEALVGEGRILINQGKKVAAKAALEKAALQLDDPAAYYYLSQLQEPGSTNQQVYLLKAATSGIIEASHNLGAFELEKIHKSGKKPTSLTDYGDRKSVV